MTRTGCGGIISLGERARARRATQGSCRGIVMISDANQYQKAQEESALKSGWRSYIRNIRILLRG